ncbi:uncharacterized protein A4U43_C01F25790 [Asparagus officinalis]|uniref:Pentacotripeptide-repeat region of PRORP domain-containing protein n=1 Tax=Asparagus officinalis TaxID=4686 RepID=A0A5P1FUP7_ASPOF|nr:uncharacterized protein A4U43_C01F25790 [Asparagus officinalis]
MPSPNLISWTSTISSFLQAGRANLALQEFFAMCNSGLKPNEFGLSLALKASRIASKPNIGKLVHGYSIKSGFESYAYCSTSILDMYSKFGIMSDARMFFHSIPQKCDALWNTLIDGYARYSDENEAVGLFHQMLLSSLDPNSFTYTILIKLSANAVDIGLLRFFHGRSIKIGLDCYNFVGGAIVDSYGKWGELDDSVRSFWSLEERDHVVWTSLLSGFRDNGDAERGIDFYLRYVSEGNTVDQFMFASVLNLCSDLQSRDFGLQVHSCLAKTPLLVDSFVRTALIDMYVSFGMVDDAYRSFLEIGEKNEVIFSAMIKGFVSTSDYSNAVKLVYEMRKLGLPLDCSTISCMIKALTSHELFDEVKTFHGQILKSIDGSNFVVGNNLIEMYSKRRDVHSAEKVFMSMEVLNEFSWTALISGYNESEDFVESLKLYQKMKSSSSVEPNEFTLVAVLYAISKLQDVCKGKQIHSYIIKKGFQSHAYIESALIGLYSNCGCLNDAYRIFSTMSKRDLVSWGYMISSYAQQGHGYKALKLLSKHEKGPIAIDESIFSSCLSACSSLTSLEMGKTIHSCTIKTGFESNIQVEAAIIDMYCKCGCVKEARKIFNEIKNHSVISYTSMICGYAQHGFGKEALEMFNAMKMHEIEPDEVTFIGVISACSRCGFLKEGLMHFESVTLKYGLEKTFSHYACIVDLLGRAGEVREAEKLIFEAPFRSKTLLWKTLLGACSKYGNVEDGNRIAEMVMRLEPDEASNYVMLSNIYSSASMWDKSSELKKKMGEGSLKKTPGCSWLQVTY